MPGDPGKDSGHQASSFASWSVATAAGGQGFLFALKGYLLEDLTGRSESTERMQREAQVWLPKESGKAVLEQPFKALIEDHEQRFWTGSDDSPKRPSWVPDDVWNEWLTWWIRAWIVQAAECLAEPTDDPQIELIAHRGTTEFRQHIWAALGSSFDEQAKMSGKADDLQYRLQLALARTRRPKHFADVPSSTKAEVGRRLARGQLW